MARRNPRPVIIKRDLIPDSRRTRIRVPQNPDRPVTLPSGDAIRREFFEKDQHWFVQHRRGPRREKVGFDPREARAVPESRVLRGTLPERIVYLALIKMHMYPGSHFDFQSSLLGGRLELGGLVADFLFRIPIQLIIRVQGPGHHEFLQQKKDEEQRMILEDMGFRVEDLFVDTIYNPFKLEDALRRIFGLGGTKGYAQGPYTGTEEPDADQEAVDELYNLAVQANMTLEAV